MARRSSSAKGEIESISYKKINEIVATVSRRYAGDVAALSSYVGDRTANGYLVE